MPDFESRVGRLKQVGLLPVSYTHLDVYKRQGGDIISKVRAQVVDRQVETIAEF